MKKCSLAKAVGPFDNVNLTSLEEGDRERILAQGVLPTECYQLGCHNICNES